MVAPHSDGQKVYEQFFKSHLLSAAYVRRYILSPQSYLIRILPSCFLWQSHSPNLLEPITKACLNCIMHYPAAAHFIFNRKSPPTVSNFHSFQYRWHNSQRQQCRKELCCHDKFFKLTLKDFIMLKRSAQLPSVPLISRTTVSLSVFSFRVLTQSMAKCRASQWALLTGIGSEGRRQQGTGIRNLCWGSWHTLCCERVPLPIW